MTKQIILVKIWCRECLEYQWFVVKTGVGIACLGCRAAGRQGNFYLTTVPVPYPSQPE